VSQEDIYWAEVIFVMEEKHKSRLRTEYADLLRDKRLYVLDIPDEYKYMDPALIDEIQRSVGAILELD
jgi:predicted protein tyrosine phosphatase